LITLSLQFYFSPRGRTGRLHYWLLGVLPLFLAGVAAGILGGYLRSSGHDLLIFYLVLAMPFVLWAWVSLGARRLHDINLSGGWMVAVLTISLAVSYLVTGHVGPSPFLLAMFVLGAIPGVVGESRFGPDPKASNAFEQTDVRSNKSP
jgi:uncharacterized membrane protein YhaH (DUF805 family)